MKHIFLVWLVLFALSGKAQTPITASLFNEATAIPFTRLVTLPIHPGIQLGTEFTYTQYKHHRLFQTANVSYFYHQYLTQGVGITTELAYEHRFHCGLAFQGLLGVGYMRSFATAEEFVFRNGQYVKANDSGKSRLCPSLSVDIGFYTQASRPYSPKLFIRYQAWAEYPYSPDFIPVMTHINLHLGTKFFINRKSTRND